MDELSAALGNAGDGVLLVWAGRDYRLALCDYATQSAFSNYLKLGAWRDLEFLRADMGEPWYKEQAKSLRDDIAAKEYEWGGHLCNKAIRQEAPQRHLLWLLLRGKNPRVTPQEADAIFGSDPDAVSEAVLEALRGGDPLHFPRPKETAGGANGMAPTEAA